MALNSVYTQNLLRDIQLRFQNFLNENKYRPPAEKFITRSPSKSFETLMHFFMSQTKIYQWIDKLKFQTLEDFHLNIENIKFASVGIMIDRDELNDCRGVGMGASIQMAIQSTFEAWMDHPDILRQMIFDTNPNCFDGAALFADTRPKLQLDGTAIDNKQAGTGVTYDKIADDIKSKSTIMKEWKDKSGRYFNNQNFKPHCLIPAALEWAFVKAGKELIDTGGTNELFNRFTFEVNNHSSNDKIWYMLNPDKQFKPVVYVERETPKWEFKDDPENLYLKYWSHARNNAAPGNPTSIMEITAP